ncbi:RNA polymerase sigma factor [Pedobacter hiemivivus]|uniref:Sigma-70 family RNA polymerase sigma factor n=1 Tax=Pedobacter hiemivivus TaxID=2530454 RepID=A0A4R0NGI7_9SPHI|nr:sigma-70 family RNA polymerase sigma factor [Pedobacter hiemivivus]TCC99555.1 sigma-70 family RNA polymerase sigma factor [Pedobacter hiemivivus]
MNNYNDVPDMQLVDLLKNSDDAAFIEIFDRYYILLFSFTIRRLNDKAISKDLIHDAFASIWENRTTINIEGELITFLFTAVKNHILDHYKHKKITQVYAENFQPYLDQVQNATNHSVRPKDIKTLIEEEIAVLPEEMRIAFELRRKSAMIVL